MRAKEVMERYYRRYDQGDEDALRDLLDDHVSVSRPDGTGSVGIEDYLITYRATAVLFFDEMRPRTIAAIGSEVVVDLVNALTAKQDVENFFGMSVRKGQTLSLELDARYRITDGRITTIKVQNKR